MITELRLRHFMTASVLIGFGCTVNAQSTQTVSSEELHAALAERDALIIALSNRLAALEQKLVAAGAIRAEVTPPPQGMPSLPASESGTAVASVAAERALEQSLIQRGNRLLPTGRFQLTIGSAYAYADEDSAEIRFRNEFRIHALQARLGLPLNSQLEVAMPWIQVTARQTLHSGGQAISDTTRTGHGLGDLRISLSKNLLQQVGWKPDLVGRLNVQLGTGKQANDEVILGGGFNGIGMDLSASWQSDPAVLFASVGFQRYQIHQGTRPGDNARVSVGLGVALSPDTSLSFSLDQSFRSKLTSGERRIDGSDQNASVFSISSATVLGRGALLQISAGIGLTPDAPDYQLGVALPFGSKGLW